MGSISRFQSTRLVIGLLGSPVSPMPQSVLTELERLFGPSRALGNDIDFSWSDYYDEELGGRPKRSFLAFADLVDPAELAAIKTLTNSLERDFSLDGRRRFNLDPGLLSLSSFVLATTKARPQRIALSAGIYADLALLFSEGDYRPLPWTYPDWASEDYRARLRALRAGLKSQLHSLGLSARD